MCAGAFRVRVVFRRTRTMHRVGALSSHVVAPAASPAPSAAAAAAHLPPPDLGELPPKLLNDAQVIDFIKSGFVILPLNDLSPEFHAHCAESIMKPWEKNARNNNWVGNNIYPANPNLGQMLATPTVRGALTSVLGPDYAMHAHRALHVSGNGDQGFHKDTPEGGGPVKHMRPRWCMIMYYPAGSTLEMGPTAILPGGQYLNTDPEKWGQVAESMGAALGLSEFKVTTPLAQGTAILIHFHMFHRGSARTVDAAESPLVATDGVDTPPLRPMVKFQFYSISEPTEPNWDAGALGEHGSAADWGALDGVHGSFSDSPQVTAVWEDILCWMRGESLPRSASPLAPKELQQLVAEFDTEDVGGEARRMGCAYLVGREAGGGSADALSALEDAIRGDSSDGGTMVSDAPGLASSSRCGIWGCVAAGDAATPMLLGMLQENQLSLVIRAGTALGESSQYPTVETIEAIGATITRLRGLTDLQAEGVSLELVKSERRLATFASKETHERYRRIEWQAMDVLAQALWYITSRAVRNYHSAAVGAAAAAAVCEAVASVIIPLMDEDINLPSTTRMNAAYTAVSLSQLKVWPATAVKEALAAALARASFDDDRYVIAAAAEGLKWMRLREIGDDDTSAAAVAARKITQKLVWERWCPVNSVRAPF